MQLCANGSNRFFRNKDHARQARRKAKKNAELYDTGTKENVLGEDARRSG